MSLFGSIASIAAPIGGFMLGGPLGAGIGGALAGGVNNRKNPLEGALLGGALGYGGAAIPGLLSSAPAAAGGLAPVETAIGTNAAGASVAANAMPAAAAGQVGAYAVPPSAGLLSQAKDVASAGGNVMTAANAAKNLTATPQKQLMPPSPIQAPMPNNNLGQLVQGMQQQKNDELLKGFQKRRANDMTFAGNFNNRGLL